MIDSYKLKEWLSWPLIRAHLCTLAVSVSYHSTWRVPREAFRYGGVQYALVLMVAMVTVALPTTLLQLAIGQLSQQDAVGIWRAVPFFRGVGYIRLLVSYLGSVYTIIYLVLTASYFFYTLSNSMPFPECVELVIMPEGYRQLISASRCLNQTFMAPVSEQPEYYIAMAMITLVLAIIFPFALYNPVKLMKRIFYVSGPLVLLLGIIILSCIGQRADVLSFSNRKDWLNFLEPHIWYGALTQSLLSTQVAGGYLISAGDSIYSSTNVQWTALTFTGVNILSSWLGLLFWYGISGSGEKANSAVAVLVQTYQLTVEKELHVAWPLIISVTLFISGVITMLTMQYPISDRLRRLNGHKWRQIFEVSSLLSAAIALVVLAGRLPALDLLENIVVPFLISICTVLEISAFVFIYGWKVLVEDVEFLTGNDLLKYWVMGWCAAPGIILPFFAWWLAAIYMNDHNWTEVPWNAISATATAAFVIVILVVFTVFTVLRQVQYDLIGKLKSSFKPSRHWGPRDPITHYYWLARREETDRGNALRTRYHRRQLGQLSGVRFLNVTNPGADVQETKVDPNRRSNSDDWLYTVYRRKWLVEALQEHLGNSKKRRSKSLDWAIDINENTEKKKEISVSIETLTSVESNSEVSVKKSKC